MANPSAYPYQEIAEELLRRYGAVVARWLNSPTLISYLERMNALTPEERAKNPHSLENLMFVAAVQHAQLKEFERIQAIINNHVEQLKAENTVQTPQPLSNFELIQRAEESSGKPVEKPKVEEVKKTEPATKLEYLQQKLNNAKDNMAQHSVKQSEKLQELFTNQHDGMVQDIGKFEDKFKEIVEQAKDQVVEPVIVIELEQIAAELARISNDANERSIEMKRSIERSAEMRGLMLQQVLAQIVEKPSDISNITKPTPMPTPRPTPAARSKREDDNPGRPQTSVIPSPPPPPRPTPAAVVYNFSRQTMMLEVNNIITQMNVKRLKSAVEKNVLLQAQTQDEAFKKLKTQVKNEIENLNNKVITNVNAKKKKQFNEIKEEQLADMQKQKEIVKEMEAETAAIEKAAASSETPTQEPTPITEQVESAAVQAESPTAAADVAAAEAETPAEQPPQPSTTPTLTPQ